MKETPLRRIARAIAFAVTLGGCALGPQPSDGVTLTLVSGQVLRCRSVTVVGDQIDCWRDRGRVDDYVRLQRSQIKTWEERGVAPVQGGR
jgi:hypothetical protein